MCAIGANRLRPMFDKQVRRLGQRSRGIDEIVNDNYVSSLHIADDFHVSDLIRLQTLLVDDNHLRIEVLFVLLDALDSSEVGAAEAQVILITALDMIDKKTQR